jgi:hypothetical protein
MRKEAAPVLKIYLLLFTIQDPRRGRKYTYCVFLLIHLVRFLAYRGSRTEEKINVVRFLAYLWYPKGGLRV